jgi:hypothetical protein
MLEYPAPTTTIAERVAYLFATQPRPGDQEYGYEELAVAFDGQLNPNEVAQLRADTIPDDQVSLRTIFQISRFFYVSPQYFYPVMMICSRNGSSLAAHARRMDEELIMALLRRPLPAGPDLPPGSVPWGQHAHMFVDTARSPRTTLQE